MPPSTAFRRGCIGGLIRAWTICIMVFPSTSQAEDRAKAARGMGYANYVYESSRCDGAIKVQAVTLQNDISTFYHFSYADLLGQTAMGQSVVQGRNAARHDDKHPEYKGQFCDSMEETLALWRSDLLPPQK